VWRNTNVISVVYFEEVKIRTKEIQVQLYVSRIPDKMHPKRYIRRFSQNLMQDNREIRYSEFMILYHFCFYADLINVPPYIKNGFWLDSSSSVLFYIIQDLRHYYDCKSGS